MILHCPHGKGGLTRPRVGGSVYVLVLKVNVGQICLFVLLSVRFAQDLSILIYNMLIRAKSNVFSGN